MSIKDHNLPGYYKVACHTDHVGPGSTFVVIKGANYNGIDFVRVALKKGAQRIVFGNDVQPNVELLALCQKYKATVEYVGNARKALAQLSAESYDHPAKKLKIIGITGTKGKTTSAYVLFELLQQAGYKTALLSTVENKIDQQSFTTHLTTQHPDYLHMFFDVCVQGNIEYVVMEVAAQALSLHRVEGIEFDAILFTNFSQEHGEFYTSIDDYFKEKCQIFNQVKNNAPIIINSDDEWLQTISIQHCLTFGQSKDAYYHVEVTSANLINFDIQSTESNLNIQSPLIGLFNVYNLSGIVSVALQLGIDRKSIQQTLKTFCSIPGRLEEIKLQNGARCFIDYAHNPSSFQSVLSTLRTMTDHLMVVSGCGGGKDKDKRPIMGSLAAEYADVFLITSDNPRFEDPAAITQDIIAGIADDKLCKVQIELDRKKAIESAIYQSRKGSIIALLGKGPDQYQLIKAEKIYFNEREIVERSVGRLNA